MRILFLALLAFAPLPAFAFGSGGGGGACCVPNSMIAHMAEAYNVPGQAAINMMETLEDEAFADLRLLQSTPAKACEVYLMCDEIPEEFFRVLLAETIERKKAAVLEVQQRRAFMFTLFTAIIAAAGLALGIFNTWHSVRTKSGE